MALDFSQIPSDEMVRRRDAAMLSAQIGQRLSQATAVNMANTAVQYVPQPVSRANVATDRLQEVVKRLDQLCMLAESNANRLVGCEPTTSGLAVVPGAASGDQASADGLFDRLDSLLGQLSRRIDRLQAALARLDAAL